MKRLLRLIVLLVILVIGIAFAGKNATSVPVHYFFGELSLPLAVIMLLSIVLGVILGIFASLYLIISTRRELSQVKRSATLAEKELTNLRSIPLKE